MRALYWMTVVLMIALIAVLTLWTLRRNHEYRSELNLLIDNYEKSPDKPRVIINLAFCLKENGHYDKAVEFLRKALKMEPELEAYFMALRYARDRDAILAVERDIWNRDYRKREQR